MSYDTPKFALTIRDPWAQAIIYGDKRIENRTRKPPSKVIGERLAIHCGKTTDKEIRTAVEFNRDLNISGWGDYLPDDRKHHPGHIIGTARVCGWACPGEDEMKITGVDWAAWVMRRDCMTIGWKRAFQKNDWWTGPVGWLLDDVRELAEPVAARGMPGVWTIDDEIRERMEVQRD